MATLTRVHGRRASAAALLATLATSLGGDAGITPALSSAAAERGIWRGPAAPEACGVDAARAHVRPAFYRLPPPEVQHRSVALRPTIQAAARGAGPAAGVDSRPAVRPIEQLELAAAAQPIRIVHFWASWCPPCIDELNAMVSFYRGAYQGLHARGLELILVSNDLRVEDIHRLTRRRPLPPPIYFDPFGDWRDVLGVPVLPATVILDREGRVLERRMGQVEWQSETFLRRLRGYLGESTST